MPPPPPHYCAGTDAPPAPAPAPAQRRAGRAAAAAAAAAAAERARVEALFDEGEEVLGRHLPPQEGLLVVLRARTARDNPELAAAYGGGRVGADTLVGNT